MALNDIKVPKENAQGTFDEIALAASDLKLGTTANLPLRTGSGGVVEAGSFGTSAGSFCEGNDARLSDDRDPNLHAASHLPEGADEIFDQSLNTADSGEFASLTLGDGAQLNVDILNVQQSKFFIDASASEIEAGIPINFTGANAATNAATTRDNLGLGDAAVEDTTAFAASGSITASGLTQATARILGRTTASTGAVEEITVGSGLSLSAGELSATSSGGISAVGASTADVLSVSGSDLVADDPNADRIVFWDDSESKLRYLEAGSGLSISGTTLTATASGGSKTYAVFTATDNQPPSTSFATLDTRNSIAVLDFDAATDKSAVFVGVIPEGASLGSGLKVFIHWMASTATSGNCRWGVQFEKSGTDLDSDSFDTATEAHSAANGTSGIETVTEITATAIDSLAAGNRFRLKVFRNADDATNDTMTGDAELIAVEVRSAA